MKWTSIKIPTKVYVRLKDLAPGRASTAPRLLALAVEEWLERNERSGGVTAERAVELLRGPVPVDGSPRRPVYDEFNQEERF